MKKKNSDANSMSRKHLMFRATWNESIDFQSKSLGDIGNSMWIRDILFTACEAASAHIRSSDYHAFYPCGITATVILAESHATVTSWPENREALFDYFSCAEDPLFETFMRNIEDRGLSIDNDSIMIVDR